MSARAVGAASAYGNGQSTRGSVDRVPFFSFTRLCLLDDNEGSSSDTAPLFQMAGDGRSTDDIGLPLLFLFHKEGNILLEALKEYREVEVLLSDKARDRGWFSKMRTRENVGESRLLVSHPHLFSSFSPVFSVPQILSSGQAAAIFKGKALPGSLIEGSKYSFFSFLFPSFLSPFMYDRDIGLQLFYPRR